MAQPVAQPAKKAPPKLLPAEAARNPVKAKPPQPAPEVVDDAEDDGRFQ